MIYLQEKNILDDYNCTSFDDGCPDMFYQSDETYKCKFSFLLPFVIESISLYMLLNERKNQGEGRHNYLIFYSPKMYGN